MESCPRLGLVNVAIIVVQRNISGFDVLLVNITPDEGRKQKLYIIRKDIVRQRKKQLIFYSPMESNTLNHETQ